MSKPDPQNPFRTMINAKRAEKGLSIEKVAKGAGVGRGTLIRWLSGSRNMTVAQLGRVLEHLGLKITAYSNKGKGTVGGPTSGRRIDVRA